jgi:hypothetical protein
MKTINETKESLLMFEYNTIMGKRCYVNPKMITVILERDNKDECAIYTCDSPDAIIVKESYDNVVKAFEKFNYQIKTVYTV